MMHNFSQYGVYAELTGFKQIDFSKAEEFLKAIRKEASLNVDVQFFDSQLIASSEHLYFAILNALEAFKNKTCISNSLAMETMLYASAQRQIKKAIELLGIKPGATELAAVIIGKTQEQVNAMLQKTSSSLLSQPDDSVLDLNAQKIPKIQQAYGVTSKMLSAVAGMQTQEQATVALVVERMALLSTQL
jgi:KEOPS complex subunit Cgi121